MNFFDFEPEIFWISDDGQCAVYHCYSEEGMLSEAWYTVDPADFNTDSPVYDLEGQFDIFDLRFELTPHTSEKFTSDKEILTLAYETGMLRGDPPTYCRHCNGSLSPASRLSPEQYCTCPTGPLWENFLLPVFGDRFDLTHANKQGKPDSEVIWIFNPTVNEYGTLPARAFRLLIQGLVALSLNFQKDGQPDVTCSVFRTPD